MRRVDILRRPGFWPVGFFQVFSLSLSPSLYLRSLSLCERKKKARMSHKGSGDRVMSESADPWRLVFWTIDVLVLQFLAAQRKDRRRELELSRESLRGLRGVKKR